MPFWSRFLRWAGWHHRCCCCCRHCWGGCWWLQSSLCRCDLSSWLSLETQTNPRSWWLQTAHTRWQGPIRDRNGTWRITWPSTKRKPCHKRWRISISLRQSFWTIINRKEPTLFVHILITIFGLRFPNCSPLFFSLLFLLFWYILIICILAVYYLSIA